MNTRLSQAGNPRLGIILMILTTMVFAVQDGISRYLAEHYNVMTIVMIRYWFFMLFVITLSHYRGGIARVARTSRPVLQITRALILVTQICVAVWAFTLVGLVDFQAIFASYPLTITAIAALFLGERVGWRRWCAVLVGMIGVLIALRPGAGMLGIHTVLPVISAMCFAVYGVLTRLVARTDTAETSFFWTGVAGAVGVSLIGPFFWLPPTGTDWYWMAALCLTGILGHFFLIKAYEVTEASTVQPFAYFQLVFASAVGMLAFGDIVDRYIIIGAIIVVGAGLFTFWRERQNR
ncbi:DMT family transporter [Alphaproteobacteria bacterium]|jgi:drug/metabolite transporter (DMT)-like permease|nr:DMT family transporter [Alphaproteobacteria bacterium]